MTKSAFDIVYEYILQLEEELGEYSSNASSDADTLRSEWETVQSQNLQLHDSFRHCDLTQSSDQVKVGFDVVGAIQALEEREENKARNSQEKSDRRDRRFSLGESSNTTQRKATNQHGRNVNGTQS